MALPMLDIESIGAGGGSIAWIDEAGRLNVGPRSAGARPGPACYGFGETDATVTDADVVLGLVNPDNYLGGRMRLDRDLADHAVDRLATRLGMTRHETAAGISTVVDAKMADLVRRMSLLRGLDPRNFACAAFGGGGPVHAPAVAAQAAISKSDRPASTRCLGAVGLRRGDLRCRSRRPAVAPAQSSGARRQPSRRSSARSNARRTRSSLARESIQRGSHSNDRCECASRCRSTTSRWLCPADQIDDDAVQRIDRRFEEVHEQLFGRGSGDRTGGIDFTAFQVRATAKTGQGRADLRRASVNQPATRARSTGRSSATSSRRRSTTKSRRKRSKGRP